MVDHGRNLILSVADNENKILNAPEPKLSWTRK